MPILTSLGSSSARAYGFGGNVLFPITISSNQTDLNLRTYALANGWSSGGTVLQVTINGGVNILASSTGASALTVNGSFPAGVLLINNGSILGYGGAGGNGGGGSFPGQPGTAGGGGGTGLSVSSAIRITNNGTVAGGGGGGGGGGGRWSGGDHDGGGGGGGGATYGAGGTRGQPTGPRSFEPQNGSAATLSAGGAGGQGTNNPGLSGSGGTGGNLGAVGADGYAAGAPGGSGGSGGGAGNYVVGNSNVIWLVNGTRLGGAS